MDTTMVVSKHNLLLPQSTRINIVQDQQFRVTSIKNMLVVALACGDFGEGVSHICRQIKTFIELKYTLDDSDLVGVTRGLVHIVCNPVVARSPATVTKILNALIPLLKKAKRRWQTAAASQSTHDSPIFSLEVAWRPLYSLFEQSIFAPTRQMPHLTSLSRHLLKLIRLCRVFFPPNTAEEILTEFVHQGNFDPHSSETLKSMGYLNLFLPTQHVSAGYFLERYVPLWSLVSHDAAYDIFWTAILSRLAGRSRAVSSTAHPIWDQVTRTALEKFVSYLNVPVGTAPAPQVKSSHSLATHASQPFLVDVGDRATCMGTMAAKLIARTCNADATAFATLSDAIGQLSTFFHPSNGGPWLSPLCCFVSVLSSRILARLWDEHVLPIPVPGLESTVITQPVPMHPRLPKRTSTHNLTQKQVDGFVSSLVNVCYMANMSRDIGSGFLIRGAITSLATLNASFVIPRLIDEGLPLVMSVQHPHQAQQTLEAFASVAPQLVAYLPTSQYPDLLAPLLHVCTANVDANDTNKSLSAIKLCMSILLALPPQTPLLPAEQFHEWAPTAVDAIWNLLRHSEQKEKRHGFDFHSIQSRILDHVIRIFCRVLFGRMSEEVYESEIRRLAEKIEDESQSEARKQFAQFVGHAASVAPRLSVPILLPPLLDLSSHLSEPCLQWRLGIAARVVCRAGSVTLNHVPALSTAIALGWTTGRDKTTKKCASKLLRATLSGLVGFHILAPSSSSPHLTAIEDTTIQWHEPSAQEMSTALSVAMSFLEESRKRAEAGTDLSKPLHTRRENILDALHMARSVLRSTAHLLPILDASPDTVSHHKHSKKRNGLTELESCGLGSWPELSPVIRLQVLNLAKDMTQWLLANDNGFVKAIQLATLIASQTVELTGSPPSSSQYSFIYSQFKNKFRVSRMTLMSVHLVHERVQLLLWQRLSQRSYGPVQSSAPSLSTLLALLTSLCTHTYSSVRAQAQASLSEVCKRYRTESSVPLNKFIEAIASTAHLATDSDQSGKHVVNGAIHALLQRSFQKKLCDRPHWTCKFLSSIVHTQHHTHPSVQAHLFKLFAGVVQRITYAPASYASEVGLLSVAQARDTVGCKETDWSSFDVAKSTWETREASTVAELENCISELVSVWRGGLHWRYQCMVVAGLHVAVRHADECLADVQARDQALAVICSALNSDNAQVREMAAVALPVLLPMPSPTRPRVAWLLSTSAPVPAPHAGSSPSVPRAIPLESEMLRKLIERLADDLSSDTAKLQGSQMSAFQATFKAVVGAIARAINNDSFPSASVIHSTPFQEVPAKWANLFARAFLATQTEPQAILPFIKTLCDKTTDSGAQSAAAVSLLGLAWAILASPSHTESFATVLTTIVDVFIASAPESSGLWLCCLRQCVREGYDSPYQATMTQLLLTPIADHHSFAAMPSSMKAKSLQVVQALLQEWSWRAANTDVVTRVLAFLEPYTAHPLKQVREEVAMTLASVAFACWAPPCQLEGVEASLVTISSAQLGAAVTNLLSQATKPDSGEEKTRLWVREVVVQFSVQLLLNGLARVLVPWARSLVPVVFAMQDDTDLHLPADARRCLVLAAASPLLCLTEADVPLLTNHVSWRVRASVFIVIQTQAFYHLHHQKQLVSDLFLHRTLSSLKDPQLEVRHLATLTLAGLCQMLPSVDHATLLKTFETDLTPKLPRDRSNEKVSSPLNQNTAIPSLLIDCGCGCAVQ
eukprot:c9535_g1_i1.p1 GENE.c9535_g1_i1~~c9535_g1_i1.p1  ORF type:complete len:1728 (+),score=364.91 c9535_g1_i1:40-5184(+)